MLKIRFKQRFSVTFMFVDQTQWAVGSVQAYPEKTYSVRTFLGSIIKYVYHRLDMRVKFYILCFKLPILNTTRKLIVIKLMYIEDQIFLFTKRHFVLHLCLLTEHSEPQVLSKSIRRRYIMCVFLGFTIQYVFNIMCVKFHISKIFSLIF